jgi:hypothetical protein
VIQRVVVTRDKKPEIEGLIRRLPAMLSGRVPDEHGIAHGFKSRLAWAFFSLVAPAFNIKGRGQTDDAGESWNPLSPSYLAYQRPVVGRQPPKGGGLAPGGKDGMLTPEQLRLWRRTFADRYAWFVMREPDDQAKAHAAAIAWIVVKERGGKTKIGTFGKRQPGVDYQILVDRGILRRSIMPGQLTGRRKSDADYRAPKNQEFDDRHTELVIGTNVPYAKYHHHAKNPLRRRRLWPERFPAHWWRQILSVGQSGLARIGDLYGGTAA